MSDVESDLADEVEILRPGVAIEDNNTFSPTQDIEQIIEGDEDEDDEPQTIEAEDAENVDNKENKPKKKIVRNPQPKLDLERLKGPKGLQALLEMFEKVNFKGDGKEEDLNLLWKTYEYWCHRMFPKLTFSACVEKLERLGKQRGVQTLMKRIRYDLTVNDDTQAPDEPQEMEESMTQDPFDEIAPQPVNAPILEEEQLTEEQLDRIRINRERAMRIRGEKMKAQQTVISSEISHQSEDMDDEDINPTARKRRRIDSSSDEEPQNVSHEISVEVDVHIPQNSIPDVENVH